MGEVIIPNFPTSWYMPGIYINVELGREPPSAAGQVRKVLLIGYGLATKGAEAGKLYRVSRLKARRDSLGNPDLGSAEDLFGMDDEVPANTSLYWMCKAAFAANPLVPLYAIRVDATETYTKVLSPTEGPVCTQRFHYIVVDDTTAASDLKGYVEGLAMPDVGLRQQGIVGNHAAAPPGTGPSPTSPRLQYVWSPQGDFVYDSSPPDPYDPAKHGYQDYMLAAAMAGTRSRHESSDPAVNLCLTEVPYVPLVETVPTKQTLNTLISEGWTPLVPFGSDTVILRSVTSAAQDPTNPVLDTPKVTVTDFVADDLELKMTVRYKGFKLAPDSDIPPPSRTATPSSVKSAILEWLRVHEKAGRICLVSDLAERVKVEIDEGVGGRLNFEIPEDVIEIFAVGAGNIIQMG